MIVNLEQGGDFTVDIWLWKLSSWKKQLLCLVS